MYPHYASLNWVINGIGVSREIPHGEDEQIYKLHCHLVPLLDCYVVLSFWCIHFLQTKILVLICNVHHLTHSSCIVKSTIDGQPFGGRATK